MKKIIRTEVDDFNRLYWILSGEQMEVEAPEEDKTKECFGPQCKGCKEFFGCVEHFPYGCWGEE